MQGSKQKNEEEEEPTSRISCLIRNPRGRYFTRRSTVDPQSQNPRCNSRKPHIPSDEGRYGRRANDGSRKSVI